MDEAKQLQLQGQAVIWKQMFSFASSMALKCAVELRIPDILHSQDRPLSLEDIASKITNTSSPDISYLSRIMRLLVHNKIFTSKILNNSGNGEDGTRVVLYGPTAASGWLVWDSNELSLAPLLLLENHPWLHSPWHQLSACVKEGGNAFEIAHGCEVWDFAAKNPKFNQLFNDGMACSGKITLHAILSAGFNGFEGLESLVDVGGGTGQTIAEIVKKYPQIRGINFDLPHVIATAPEYPGVSYVSGDMFKEVPSAQAIFMKWIMHDWGDEDCLKILKNCRKAIPEKTGKIFIVDLVVKPNGDDLFGSTGLAFDLLMMAHTRGGLERTELEWKSLLEKAGFPRYKITQIPTMYSIIETYPS